MKTIICDDAINWLKLNTFDEHSSFFASLPDISEFPKFSLNEWEEWFSEMAKLIMSKTHENQVAIFFQSDIKFNGIWVDKSFLIQRTARELGMNLLWHKIACRAPVDMTTFGRPSYSHILCFSKSLKLELKNSSPDVLSSVGEKTWERGTGQNVCEMICKFLVKEVFSKQLINPFCGEGLILKVAESFGLDSIGIEKSNKRAKIAQQLS